MPKRVTTKSFIKSAKAVHGDRYDYSLAEYVNSTTDITIVCKQHGTFHQSHSNHLAGKGCPLCGNITIGQKLASSTKAFIERAVAVHGNEYIYDKVEYVNARTKVLIVCPTHGDFWQVPDSHLHGSGCKKCKSAAAGQKRRLSTADFLQRARQIHGNRYDYTRVNYINNSIPVDIICQTHGTYWQTPTNHLAGKQCPKCMITGGWNIDTTETFVIKAVAVHGNQYDYTKVNYIDSITPVQMVCPEHGEFWQVPNRHIQGSGCIFCAIESRAALRTKSTNDFIELAIKVHGNRYDYSKTQYTGYDLPLTIICPVHGDFQQVAGYHTGGNGCPQCNLSSGESAILRALDTAGIPYESQVRFSDCVYIAPLVFDFCVRLNGRMVLIEYNGRQHYQPVERFGGEAALIEQKARDQAKHEYAVKNKIPLIIVEYTIDDVASYVLSALTSLTSTPD